jgi:hypothetical protein
VDAGFSRQSRAKLLKSITLMSLDRLQSKLIVIYVLTAKFLLDQGLRVYLHDQYATV